MAHVFTIKDVIIQIETRKASHRLLKLMEIGAPEVMTKSIEDELDRLEDNILIGIGGDLEALEDDYIDHEIKVGNGGDQYISFNNGTVNYFPRAKYGRCIYRKKDSSTEQSPVTFSVI